MVRWRDGEAVRQCEWRGGEAVWVCAAVPSSSLESWTCPICYVRTCLCVHTISNCYS